MTGPSCSRASNKRSRLQSRSRWSIHYCFDEIAELVWRELIAFNIRRQFSVTIDDDRVKGVSEQAFAAPEVHAKHSGYLTYLFKGPSQEMPDRGVSFPRIGILRQDLALIVVRVNHDCEQDEISAVACAHALFNVSEIAGHAKTIVGIGAT